MTRGSDNQAASAQFLLSESGSDAPVDLTTISPVSLGTLKTEFPTLLTDENLIHHIEMELAAAEQFGAAVLQIDGLADQPDPDGLMIALLHRAEAIVAEKDAILGVLDKCRLALAVPGRNADDIRALAEQLQTRFAEKTGATATAGIAQFPTLAYEHREILDNARKALVHAEFFGPGSRAAFDSVSLNISGDQYYQQGELEQAMKEFNLALALDPENVNVYNSLGVCHGINGDFDKALDAFGAANRLDPDEVMPIYNAGYVHMLKKEYGKALEHFRKAEQIDTSVFELAFQTGRAHLATENPDAARAYLESATRLYPQSSPAFRFLGQCYHQLDRLSDAESAYKTALKLNPEDADALSTLGYIYETLGKNGDIALLFCQQSCDIAPESGLFRHRLARIHLNRNQIDDALKEFHAAQQLGYTSTEYIDRLHQQMNPVP